MLRSSWSRMGLLSDHIARSAPYIPRASSVARTGSLFPLGGGAAGICGGGSSHLAAAGTASAAVPVTGPAAGGVISDELLAKLGGLSTQALVDGLWVMGWPTAFIEGARPLAPGQRCAGRAVTLRMVPQRPDIGADKPGGGDSPEYQAFELCGPSEVLVISSVGPWESVGGDIKFLRLKQREVGGLVTDGSVRDTDELLSYGFPVFSHSTTPKQGPAAMQPWECNGLIECGGVAVRPGDAVVGDQDGVVVVPAAVAATVYSIAHGRETIEDIVKEELTADPGPPGRYYPFMSGKIKTESPLGQLLLSKGITPENSNQFEGSQDW